MKDYYKILEVEENSTQEEIKKSYRNLSKKYHPDVYSGGDEKFKEIAEAYETLGDKDKRQQYDYKRKNPFKGTSIQDMFSQMFGGNADSFRQNIRKKSPDKVIKIKISPIESYFGSEKEFIYNREIGCNICGGSGGEQSICTTCGGSGFQVKTFGTGFMVQQIRTTCNACLGNGFFLKNKCNNCDGRGTKTSNQNLKIKIPVGADNGQFLKLENLGDFKHGEYGNLVIQIELEPKNNFEKINNDLIYNLFLDLEGIQKEKYSIPHPDGDLNVDAPKIIDTSRPLRLRGKGFFGGDMYVKLNLRFERPI
jgi:molecular chaperone DnaJ